MKAIENKHQIKPYDNSLRSIDTNMLSNVEVDNTIDTNTISELSKKAESLRSFSTTEVCPKTITASIYPQDENSNGSVDFYCSSMEYVNPNSGLVNKRLHSGSVDLLQFIALRNYLQCHSTILEPNVITERNIHTMFKLLRHQQTDFTSFPTTKNISVLFRKVFMRM
ncbi:hypothetical protein MN116_004206 [Schistosoma mekongi]|uniref:Uncharacterized protein n=1 Tax=Schistosoma mekongi TaxID=38744 RepID=A0AAE1ZFQ3_SCHME|nr:hypothetical protein MN116_004206 [Schistosoma mekongi]